LKTIFAGSLYKHRPLSGDAWTMLVSLFGGLRLNEACQLSVTDIEVIGEVPVIHVRHDDAGKAKIKTSAGIRTVPIHSQLVKIGLLNHWRAMKKKGESQLFPDLKAAASGYLSDLASKRLNRFIRGLGISDRRAVVHSLRHNWRDALREAGVSNERVRALGGWTSKSEGEEARYGSGLTPKALAVEIEKITYVGLDLSRLFTRT
jgi:integrase